MSSNIAPMKLCIPVARKELSNLAKTMNVENTKEGLAKLGKNKKYGNSKEHQIIFHGIFVSP